MPRHGTGAVLLASLALIAIGVAIARSPGSGSDQPSVDLGCASAGVVRAVSEASADVTSRPDSAEAWGALGSVYLAHGFDAAAYDCLDRAGRLDATDPRWPHLIGCALDARTPACAAALLRAAELAPTVAAPRSRLADVLLLRGDAVAARREALLALGADREDARANFVIARVARDTGDLAAARDHLERAALAAPQMQPVHVLLAEVCAALGDVVAARAENRAAREARSDADWPDVFLDPVRALCRSPAVILGRAEALRAAGKPVEAERLLSSASADDPDVAGLRVALAMHRVGIRDGRGAEDAVAPVIERDPCDVGAQYALGCALALQGRLVEAEAHLRTALRGQPDLAAAHYDLAQCLEARGETEAALASYRSAIEGDPRNVVAARRAGELLFALRRYGEAVGMLERARVADARDPELERLIVRAHAALDASPR